MNYSLKLRKQLHMGVKVVLSIIFSFALALLSVLCAAILYNFTKLSLDIGELINRTMNSLDGYVLVSIFTIIFFLISYRFLVKKKVTSWETLGLQHNLYASLKHCAIGFVIGTVIICTTMLILINLNEVSISYAALNSKYLLILLSGFVIQFSVALSEEITFRGFIQGEVYKTTANRYSAVFVTSLAFALIHLLNGSYTLLSLVYIFISGILFSVLRLMISNLWLVVGFHLANNWVEIYVFGFNTNNERHWLSTINETNSIWNGGESGGGLIYIGMLLVTLVVFLLWNKSRNGILHVK